jgi:hypothetical protein
MQLIQGCFELLQKHLSAKKYKKGLNDAKEAELCAIAEDCFKDIKDESMREAAMAQYATDALDKNSAVVCDLMKEKFGGSKDDLYSRYNDQMNHVVLNVLFFHPCILQKRIIVFPNNLRNNHWGATFVFSAGDITAAIDDASSGSCMTCFLCYCSLYPCCMTRIPNEIGIVWFLNLAFGTQEEQNTIARQVSIPQQIKWHSPFGRTFLRI